MKIRIWCDITYDRCLPLVCVNKSFLCMYAQNKKANLLQRFTTSERIKNVTCPSSMLPVK